MHKQNSTSENLSNSMSVKKKNNNTSLYVDEYKKEIIKKSEYTLRNALEVASFLIETNRFEIFYKEMLVADAQRELDKLKEEMEK